MAVYNHPSPVTPTERSHPMLIRLQIEYAPQADTCTVNGIPLAELPDGQRVVMKGLCYAALEKAKDAVSAYDPNAKPPGILQVHGAIPRLNGQ